MCRGSTSYFFWLYADVIARHALYMRRYVRVFTQHECIAMRDMPIGAHTSAWILSRVHAHHGVSDTTKEYVTLFSVRHLIFQFGNHGVAEVIARCCITQSFCEML